MSEQVLDAAAYVHEGFWTNWSKSRVTGFTLTLCPTHGTLVTNAVALFVTVAGSQLWTIMRFTLHQVRASRQPTNCLQLHNQQQLILRNAPTDLATVPLMMKLAWASWKSTRRPFSYPLLIATLAISHVLLFMLAGTFSNNLVNAGNSVLSRSHHCGVFNQTYLDIAANGINPASTETLALSVQYFSKIQDDVELSREYAEQCYMSNPKYYVASACNNLKNATLNVTETVHDGLCPFDSKLCHDNSETVVLDTGDINTHTELGINAEPKDRLTYRRITTCAVLNATNHVTGWNGSLNTITNGTSQSTAYANYGASLVEETEWTYSYSNFLGFGTNFSSQATMPYQINTQWAYPDDPDGSGGSSFIPMPALQQEAADTTLFFLSFAGQYLEQPIDDPWFSAHQIERFDDSLPISHTRYARDTAISTLGCLERHRFCTDEGHCSPFLGFNQLQGLNSFISTLTSRQNVTFNRVLNAVQLSALGLVVEAIAVTNTPLLATNVTVRASNVLSLPLPDHQWLLELRYWHSVAMAQLQRTVVQWGTGQIASSPQYLLPPQTNADSWFCANLMVPSTVYQSFNVLALILIAIFGSLVIAVSLTIEDIAAKVQRQAGKSPTRRRFWDRDDMLKINNTRRTFSWKPKPPPKDSVPRQDSLTTKGTETTMVSPPNPVLLVPKSSRCSPHERQPLAALEKLLNDGTVGMQEQAHAPPLTPRIWSNLPGLPVRDSWTEGSTNTSRLAEPPASPPRPFKQGPDLRFLPAAGMDSTGGVLHISHLREHAIARSKRSCNTRVIGLDRHGFPLGQG